MSHSPVLVSVQDVSFYLKEVHDFSWLGSLGEVFCVFDQQDSGNLSFGVWIEGQKRFVKYAGAKTVHFSGDSLNSIKSLKASKDLYDALKHPSLVNCLASLELDHGYALIFDWFEGECLHSHWAFPPPDKYTHPNSPFYRFRKLAIEDRLKAYQTILDFHVYVEEHNYVAIDFYDGSILYDFQTKETKVCDIDCYAKKSYINRLGKLWGSKRFMSPEELTLNASIDSRTNVFNMGATAFVLFGGELDRNRLKWEASESLYHVALKAVQLDPEKRYETVRAYSQEWRNSRG